MTEVKELLGASPFPSGAVVSFPAYFIGKGEYMFFDLPFLANMPEVSLFVILCVHCQVQFLLYLGLPHPINKKQNIISVLFPGHLSLFPLPVHLFLSFPFDQLSPT